MWNYFSYSIIFKLKVDNRDREIERLNRMLDGGRSYDAVALESKLRNNEKLISHQNIQVKKLFCLVNVV
jgi:centrosomal protein CEP135